MPNCFSGNYKSPYFPQNPIVEELIGETDDPRRILVVVDALKEFPPNLLESILRRFTTRDCTVTLLGVKPWLNIPLSSKTSSDIWSLKIEDVSSPHETKNDPKYQKVQRLIELCQSYGVVPEIKSETGYPVRPRVLEQICTLHATLVVFVRHCDKKSRDYYAEKIPCHMVVINENGKVDLIKKGKRDNNCPSAPFASPCSSTTQSSYSAFSEKFKRCIKRKGQRRHNRSFKSM